MQYYFAVSLYRWTCFYDIAITGSVPHAVIEDLLPPLLGSGS